MFSRFSTYMKKNDSLCRADFYRSLQAAYSPAPDCEHLHSIANIRDFFNPSAARTKERKKVAEQKSSENLAEQEEEEEEEEEEVESQLLPIKGQRQTLHFKFTGATGEVIMYCKTNAKQLLFEKYGPIMRTNAQLVYSSVPCYCPKPLDPKTQKELTKGLEVCGTHPKLKNYPAALRQCWADLEETFDRTPVAFSWDSGGLFTKEQEGAAQWRCTNTQIYDNRVFGQKDNPDLFAATECT
jgi:hypothetical protein